MKNNQNKNKEMFQNPMHNKMFRNSMLVIEISFFIFIIFFLFNLDKKGWECQTNPIPYGIKDLQTATSSIVHCRCSAMELNGELIFNENGLVIQNVQEFLLLNLTYITFDNLE